MTTLNAHLTANANANANAGPRQPTALRSSLVALRTIARMTWLEAMRSRWSVMLLLALLLLLTLVGFVGEWAMVEKRQVVVSVLAPISRLLAVLMVLLIAVSSVVREFSERSIMLLLAAPVSRATWVSGRVLGLSAISAATAAVLAIPVLWQATAADTLVWALSLWLELSVVACAGLLVACVFRQVPAATLAVLSFYVLSRLIGVLMMIAEHAPYDASAATAQLTHAFLRLLGLLLPRFDLFTQTGWLLDGATVVVLVPVVSQSIIYLALLWLVARIDFSGAEL